MDNRILVGIGNIYANEALFLAHIHPQTSASSPDAHQCILLQQAIQTTLTAAIRLGGSITPGCATTSTVGWQYRLFSAAAAGLYCADQLLATPSRNT